MLPRPETIVFPPEVLQRVERVRAYHEATKHTYESVRSGGQGADRANQPSPYRVFPDRPKVALPTSLLDLPVSALRLLRGGLEALPESQISPPQDLKTLATWLYMADGVLNRQEDGQTVARRPCPSAGALYPYEIYVAAFGMGDLPAGLYHYSPREFSLRRLREGGETLARLKRGRPDMEFLKNAPVAMLVSTIFWRSAWKYRERGYRYALLDAGHLLQNLVTVATALGIATQVRLRLSDSATRELIGVPADAPFEDAEAVQAMVVWDEQADSPLHVSAGAAEGLAAIARPPLSAQHTEYPQILTVHHDCVAPGVAVSDVRPPLTDLSPLPPGFATEDLPGEPVESAMPLRQALLGRRSTREYARQSISRDQFFDLNELAFRGGTFHPLKPEGGHVALVRPLWIVNDVSGLDPGIWYFHPPTAAWSLLRGGSFWAEGGRLSLEQEFCAKAAALCFMAVNLNVLMQAGPDAYRLAHLEGGAVGQRLYLAATAMGLGCTSIAAFYDDDIRRFLGLERTAWEIVYEIAIGVPAAGS